MDQAELHSVTGALAALDDDLDMIQQQLELQMQAQDQNQDDARYSTAPGLAVQFVGQLQVHACQASRMAVAAAGSWTRS